MSMLGAKKEVIRQWHSLNEEYANYQFELYGEKKYFDPFGGYDQLGFSQDPVTGYYNRNESLLYATYRLLRQLMSLNSDLKYVHNYNSSIDKSHLKIVKRINDNI